MTRNVLARGETDPGRADGAMQGWQRTGAPAAFAEQLLSRSAVEFALVALGGRPLSPAPQRAGEESIREPDGTGKKTVACFR